MVYFKYNIDISPLSGRLIYRESECSFDFIDYVPDELFLKNGKEGSFLLCVNELLITTDIETGALLYPWGYFPLIDYEVIDMPVHSIVNGAVYAHSESTIFSEQMVLEVPGSSQWKVFRDMATGWVCVGDCYADDQTSIVQFAQNVMISIRGGVAVALWLKPEIELESDAY